MTERVKATRDAASPTDKDQPAWVKAGIGMIRRAQVVDPVAAFASRIVSVQPMTQPIGGSAFYRARYGRWEPSAVDRLAALGDPEGELAKRIAGYDKIGKFTTFNPRLDQGV